MRADRLVATLLLMQSRGRVTAAELADELEVSVATARRDLEALSAAGIPVYPQPGRGGGWSLVGGARTDLTGLSATEAQALFLLVGPAAAVSGEAKAALRKLVRALPQTFRADAEAAASATMIDPTRWGERDRHRPEMVDLLQDAVVRRRKVRLTYTNSARQRSRAAGRPVGPGRQGRHLVPDRRHRTRASAPSGSTGSSTPRSPTEPAEPARRLHAGRRLGARSSDEVEQRRSRTWATVLIETRFVPILRDHFGRHCHTDGELDDGRTRVRLAAPTPLDIARNLAGWGATGRGARAGVRPRADSPASAPSSPGATPSRATRRRAAAGAAAPATMDRRPPPAGPEAGAAATSTADSAVAGSATAATHGRAVFDQARNASPTGTTPTRTAWSTGEWTGTPANSA